MITALECSLVGQQQRVNVRAGTRAAALYGDADPVEDYYCNYGVNPEYDRLLEDHGLVVSGVGEAGEMRIVELPDHPFFLATLFLPQARSKAARPHPLLIGYAEATQRRSSGAEGRSRPPAS